ncbi:MAG TPA: histidine--tRNA ligase, partial [Clostridiaceae bacterium]|nr:histidine--tRNA ligase [Clostridiaceae bacterium]
MKKTPVKGTNDYLPEEVAVRDYMQNKILQVYENNGYQRIMTPALEDVNNLDNSDGGENLNLIFKILKRGDKLNRAIAAEQFDALADLGLRYDLTLPLCRYYANNSGQLLNPMKVIQIDKVYRAERPQRGRLREFMQCDIDIIGSESEACEIELILTMGEALQAIGLEEFKVRINDRRILLGTLESMGFPKTELESVCMSFDKFDKIGAEGVVAELTNKELPSEAIEALNRLMISERMTLESLPAEDDMKEYVDRMSRIISAVETLNRGRYEIEFDISLVRGQGYYTGAIFEIESTKFSGSLAGGGRYDNLIGKFINRKVPAVGFSIGFERIFSLLMEDGNYHIPDQKKKVVVLYEAEDFTKAWEQSALLRKEYDVLLYERPKKTGRLLNQLKEHGYASFMIYGQDEELRELE